MLEVLLLVGGNMHLLSMQIHGYLDGGITCTPALLPAVAAGGGDA
jgi:hypothetical protein